MRTIYKYDITTAENGIITGPITKLLTAQVQHGNIVLWAEVDTAQPDRKFQVIPIGTGWPLDAPAGKECILDNHAYIGTVQLAGGSLVLHIYAKEITPAPVKTKISEPVKEAVTRTAVKKGKEATFTVTNCVINPEILSVFTK